MNPTFRLKDKNHLLISGSLHLQAVEDLSLQVNFALNTSIDVIDLSEVSYIDSSGIALLFQWQKIASKKNVELRFISLPQQLKKLIGLYNLDFLLESNNESSRS